MSDIVCRCGEPWDSTGGLHHTHSDLPWWQYEQLVRGIGCPSCDGDFEQTPEADERWQRSVEALSEGEEPYPGFPLPVAPYWLSSDYRGSNNEPRYWEVAAKEPADTKVLSWFGEMLEIEPRWLNQYDPEDVLWYCMPPGRFVAGRVMADGSDLVREVNTMALLRLLEDAEHIHQRQNGEVWVGVGQYKQGEITAFKLKDGTYIAHTISALVESLHDYPCLDDDLLSEKDYEMRGQLIDSWIDDNQAEIAVAWGRPETDIPLLLDRGDGFFDDYQSFGLVWQDKEPEANKLITKLFDEYALPPTGWQFLLTHDPEAWVVSPRFPGFDQLSSFPGFKIRADGQCSWVWRYPSTQVRWSRLGFPLEDSWTSIPVAVRQAINELLHEDAAGCDQIEDEPPTQYAE